MRLSRRLEIDIWGILEMCQAKTEKLFVNVVLCKNMKIIVNMKINMKRFCCLLSGVLKLAAPLVITALIDDDDCGIFFKKTSYVYIKSKK